MVDPEVNNPADQISQKEKREVQASDRLARSTYFQHAQADPDLELGGRFKKLTPSTVVGSGPVSYPRLPETSPWSCDPCPPEPTLGYSVEEHEPVGGDAASTTTALAVGEGDPAAQEVVSVAVGSKFKRRI
jgi:hypothetical protein